MKPCMVSMKQNKIKTKKYREAPLPCKGHNKAKINVK
jgi:hypothetical protein